MSKHTLLSLALPQRLTHVTVATLSPRITMGSPTESGVSPANSSITHAVTTIPNSSSKFIVMVHVSRRSAFRFSSCQPERQVISPIYLLLDTVTADRFEAGVG